MFPIKPTVLIEHPFHRSDEKKTLHQPVIPSWRYIQKIKGKEITIAEVRDESDGIKYIPVEKCLFNYSIYEDLSLGDVIFAEPKKFEALPIKNLVNDSDFIALVPRFFEEKNLLNLAELSQYDISILLDHLPESYHPNLHKINAKGRVILNQYSINVDFAKKVLQRDPQAIFYPGTETPSLMVSKARDGYHEIAMVYLQAMEIQGVPFTSLDTLCANVLRENPITDEVFLALSKDEQSELYYLANALRKVELISQLRHLGMGREVTLDDGSYFSSDMDIIQVQQAVHNLFMKMRSKGDLLTTNEYDKRYPQVREGCVSFGADEGNGFVDKGSDISRLFGALCFNKRTRDYPFTRATRTILVLKKNVLNFELNTQYFTTFQTDSKTAPLSIKAEYIPLEDKTLRILSEEESMDFVRAIIRAEYNDLHLDLNIRITPQGPVVIDNEIRNLGGLSKEEHRKLRYRFEKCLHPTAQAFLDEIITNYKKPKRCPIRDRHHEVGLRSKMPIPFDTSAILSTPLGHRTKKMTVYCDTGFGNHLEVRGEGPGMSWQDPLFAHNIDANTWTVDMPEGNYFYKYTLRYPNGSTIWEDLPGNRMYHFSKPGVSTPSFLKNAVHT